MGSKSREAVYVGVIDGDFRPQRPWDMPERFVELRLYAKNLTQAQAGHFVSVFNQGKLNHLEERITEWAVYSRFVRPRQIDHAIRENILNSAPKETRIKTFAVCSREDGEITPLQSFLEYPQAVEFRDSMRAIRPETAPFIVRLNRRVAYRPPAALATVKGGA